MRWVAGYDRHETPEWELVRQEAHRGLSMGCVVKEDGMYIAYSAGGDREMFDSLGEAKGWVESQAGAE